MAAAAVVADVALDVAAAAMDVAAVSAAAASGCDGPFFELAAEAEQHVFDAAAVAGDSHNAV